MRQQKRHSSSTKSSAGGPNAGRTTGAAGSKDAQRESLQPTSTTGSSNSTNSNAVPACNKSASLLSRGCGNTVSNGVDTLKPDVKTASVVRHASPLYVVSLRGIPEPHVTQALSSSLLELAIGRGASIDRLFDVAEEMLFPSPAGHCGYDELIYTWITHGKDPKYGERFSPEQRLARKQMRKRWPDMRRQAHREALQQLTSDTFETQPLAYSVISHESPSNDPMVFPNQKRNGAGAGSAVMVSLVSTTAGRKGRGSTAISAEVSNTSAVSAVLGGPGSMRVDKDAHHNALHKNDGLSSQSPNPQAWIDSWIDAQESQRMLQTKQQAQAQTQGSSGRQGRMSAWQQQQQQQANTRQAPGNSEHWSTALGLAYLQKTNAANVGSGLPERPSSLYTAVSSLLGTSVSMLTPATRRQIDHIEFLRSNVVHMSPVVDWSPREIALFEIALCVCGPNFSVVSSIIETKSYKQSYTFYAEVFKKTHRYQVFKEFKKLADWYYQPY